MTYFPYSVKMMEQGGKLAARVNIHELAQMLASKGVGPTWPITITVFYRSM
jgi:hypothetical protein